MKLCLESSFQKRLNYSIFETSKNTLKNIRNKNACAAQHIFGRIYETVLFKCRYLCIFRQYNSRFHVHIYRNCCRPLMNVFTTLYSLKPRIERKENYLSTHLKLEAKMIVTRNVTAIVQFTQCKKHIYYTNRKARVSDS